MDAIIVQALVTADRRLIVELPANVPVGPVTVTIQPSKEATVEAPTNGTTSKQPLTREEARAKLLAAGRLSTETYAPDGAVHSTPEETARLAARLSNSPESSLDLVDWTRGPKS